jgi:hypothetical protein
MKFNTSIGRIVAIIIVAVTVPAAAVTVNYTVGGSGPTPYPAPTPAPPSAPWGATGYPGDTVELQAYSGALNLAPGTQILKVNTILWTVDYTYGGTVDDPNTWSDLAFGINANRSITVDTAGGTITQAGLLEATWEDDYLTFSGGTPVSFLVDGEPGVQYSVQVTALGLARVGAFSGWPNKCDLPCPLSGQDLMAEFVVDLAVAVEPTTWGGVKALFK